MLGISRISSNIQRFLSTTSSVIRKNQIHKSLLLYSSHNDYSKQVRVQDFTHQKYQTIQNKSCSTPTSSTCKLTRDLRLESSAVGATAEQLKKQLNLKASSHQTPPPPSPEASYSRYFVALLGVAGVVGAGLYYKNSLQLSQGSSSNGQQVDKKVKAPNPLTSNDIPSYVPYLLIGGGTASFAAFRAIKSNDAKAKILLISEENETPYMRPPLSKEIWFDTELATGQLRFKQWNGIERSLYYEPEDFYMDVTKLMEAPNGGVAVARGYSVKKINVLQQTVTLSDGKEIRYDKCLIATGATPKSLSVFDRASVKTKSYICSYKSLKDFENLKKNIEKSKSIAVIGGGFLGSELSCALAFYAKEKDLKVYQVFREKGNMGKILPEYLSEWTTERVKEEGVEVLSESYIKDVEIFNGNQLKLCMQDGKSIIVDQAILAVGSEPNTQLAINAGLEVDLNLGGFVVNAELEARTNLFAAGDAACFYDPYLGRRRVEHHDHAVVSGRLAGENMVGLKKPYKHQSMFWSDLGPNVGYEAIGVVDSKLKTVAVFAKKSLSDGKTTQLSAEISDSNGESTADNVKNGVPSSSSLKEESIEDYGKGVVFYLKNDKIVGILLWNLFNRITIARKVLNQDIKYENLNEVAKLFDVYEQN